MSPSLEQILLLCLAAFAAGFVDAIVGGGGLIQTPSVLVLLHAFPLVNAMATTKIPSFSGTFSAFLQYMRRVAIHFPVAALMCTIAFFASFAGSQVLTLVHNDFMKPVLLVVLVAVAIYTYTKKDFGQQEARETSPSRERLYIVLISLVVGFYDGFIGPGAGSFFILAFVSLLGFDFLKASAHAKLANLSTNLGSIVLFTLQGKIIWAAALPMAACNAFGGWLGARIAIARGNRFIRIFFLAIVIGTLFRFALDVFR